MKTVQLFSGGMDSIAIEHVLQPDVRLFVHLGTPVCDQEMDRVMDFMDRTGKMVTCVHLEGLAHYELANKILPGRNSYFVLMAANYGEKIVLGSTLGDTTKDKDPKWAVMMTHLLRYMMTPGKQPRAVEHALDYLVDVPFRTHSKGQLVANYLAADGPENALIDSYSCYNGQKQECGVSRACQRKYVALAYNGAQCWDRFHTDPRDQLYRLLDYSIEVRRHHLEIAEIKTVMAQGRR
jgi:7-cyano-7-deazaguanine synthase in queuosine biosynthesis